MEEIYNTIINLLDNIDDSVFKLLNNVNDFNINDLYFLIGRIIPNTVRKKIWKWYYKPDILEESSFNNLKYFEYYNDNIYIQCQKIIHNYYNIYEDIPGFLLSNYIMIKKFINKKHDDEININQIIYMLILLSSIYYETPCDMSIIYSLFEIVINRNFEFNDTAINFINNELDNDDLSWFKKYINEEYDLKYYFNDFFYYKCIKSFRIEISRFIWDEIILLNEDYTIICKSILTYLLIIKKNIIKYSNPIEIKNIINNYGYNITPLLFIDNVYYYIQINEKYLKSIIELKKEENKNNDSFFNESEIDISDGYSNRQSSII